MVNFPAILRINREVWTEAAAGLPFFIESRPYNRLLHSQSHVLWFGEDGTKTDSAIDSSLTFTAVTHSAISHTYIFFEILFTPVSKTLLLDTIMATRRLLTTPFLGRGRVPSSFRYSNHLRSFQIPHSTLAASSGPSAPSNHERTVSIQIVLRSSLPEVSQPI